MPVDHSGSDRSKALWIAWICIMSVLLLREPCTSLSSDEIKPHQDDNATLDSYEPVKLRRYVSNYTGPQTVYKPWPKESRFPCFEEPEPTSKSVTTQHLPTKRGILYTREMKTGSSTFASVLLRIAHNKGKEMLRQDAITGETSLCEHRVGHIAARQMEYHKRDRSKSFHLSLLRNPTKRIISHFFHFRVSNLKRLQPTDANFMEFLNKPATIRTLSNYYAKDLSLYKIDVENEDADTIIAHILSEYDFIGITERMDESLVVLKNLLHLDLTDVLYTSAKNAGSFNAVHPQKLPCAYLTPSFVTPGMRTFFDTDYFTSEYIGIDNRLYEAAHVSLDNTIDKLGREKIEAEVRTFRAMVAIAQSHCEKETKYRCDEGGNFRGQNGSNCLMWDLGCGYECLRSVSESSEIQRIQRSGSA